MNHSVNNIGWGDGEVIALHGYDFRKHQLCYSELTQNIVLRECGCKLICFIKKDVETPACDQVRNKHCFKLKEVSLNQCVKQEIIGGKIPFSQNWQSLRSLNNQKKGYVDLLQFLEFCSVFLINANIFPIVQS